jgi:hypothetical protein
MTQFLNVDIADGIAPLTMNSPQTRNVLGLEQPSAEIEAECGRRHQKHSDAAGHFNA